MRSFFIVVILLLTGMATYAQNNNVSAGGTATGSGGGVTYTVGQIAYTASTGTNGTIIRGVQQPFEISVITSIRNPQINLSAKVYPNPSNGSFILTVERSEYKNLSYVLLDIDGRTILQNKLTDVNTVIDIPVLSSGVYLLKVFSKQTLLRTFKIEKTK